MMCLQLHKIFLTFICIITLYEYVFSQVNRDSNQLVREIFSRIRNNSNKPWFRLEKMTHYATFMLCIDAYQKLLGIRVMEEHYFTENETTALPKLKMENLKIINTQTAYASTIIRKVMHCPLHKVQFSSRNYSYGEEFYVSEGRLEPCVYVYTIVSRNSEKFPTLEVKAKVCELMVNIRYNNKLELDHEFSAIKAEFGLHLLKWSNVALDNEIAFTMCLDIQEKFFRTQLYSYTFMMHNQINQFPTINVMHRKLSLINGNKTVIVDNIEVIYCPLNEIKFLNDLQIYELTSFYLAKSFHTDCVYEMKSNNENTLQIKAEICGIYNIDNNDEGQLDRDLIHRIGFSKDPSFNFLSWDEIHYLSQTFRYHMCINVVKRVHLKYFFMLHDNRFVRKANIFTITENFNLKLGMIYKRIKVLKCPMNAFINQHLLHHTFYLANSPRIGCVYRLTQLLDEENSLKIQNLICGIYPLDYLLGLQLNFIEGIFTTVPNIRISIFIHLKIFNTKIDEKKYQEWRNNFIIPIGLLERLSL